jgi:hypothetical protein
MKKRIAVAAAGGLLLGYSTATFAGLSFTQVTTVNGDRSMVTKVVSDGANARSEMVESPGDNPFMPAGSYMLFNDGEMFLINPSARTFARFDSSMFEGMTEVMGQIEIADVTFEKVLDEDGENIAGYPTRHYQFKSSWTMGMQGMPMKTETSLVEDIWTTTAIDVPDIAAGAADALPEQVKAFAETQGLLQVEGFPLKRVSVQGAKMNMGGLGGLGGLGARMATRMAGGAGSGDTTTTMEVVDLAEVEVPAATFAIPDGYKETQLFQSGPAVPDLNDVQEAPAVPNLNDLDN